MIGKPHINVPTQNPRILVLCLVAKANVSIQNAGFNKTPATIWAILSLQILIPDQEDMTSKPSCPFDCKADLQHLLYVMHLARRPPSYASVLSA